MKYTDISSKLDDSFPYLTVAKGEHYEINDDKNNILAMNAMLAESKTDIDSYYNAVVMLLGEDAVAEIEKKHPKATTRLSSLRILFMGAMAAVGGASVEETEKRFHSAIDGE